MTTRDWHRGGAEREAENGMGWGGLVPTRAEREEDRTAAELRRLRAERGELVKALREIASGRCPAPYPMNDKGLADYRADVARAALGNFYRGAA